MSASNYPWDLEETGSVDHGPYFPPSDSSVWSDYDDDLTYHSGVSSAVASFDASANERQQRAEFPPTPSTDPTSVRNSSPARITAPRRLPNVNGYPYLSGGAGVETPGFQWNVHDFSSHDPDPPTNASRASQMQFIGHGLGEMMTTQRMDDDDILRDIARASPDGFSTHNTSLGVASNLRTAMVGREQDLVSAEDLQVPSVVE